MKTGKFIIGLILIILAIVAFFLLNNPTTKYIVSIILVILGIILFIVGLGKSNQMVAK